jgi:hypothetical protein
MTAMAVPVVESLIPTAASWHGTTKSHGIDLRYRRVLGILQRARRLCLRPRRRAGSEAFMRPKGAAKHTQVKDLYKPRCMQWRADKLLRRARYLDDGKWERERYDQRAGL